MAELAFDDSILPFDDDAARPVVREQLGARRVIIRQTRAFWRNWTDINTSDYAFFDKLRRGQARGYELSGLLVSSISRNIASWGLGRLPQWETGNDSISSQLNDWWRKWLPVILRSYRESLDMGDSYLVMNGDSSVTIVPPDAVTPLVAENDPGRWIGWKIETTVPHPTEPGKYVTYEDHYTAIKRVLYIKNYDGTPMNGKDGQTFINPMGRVPVIHVANRKGADERFGRPECEGLINLLLRYGDVLDAALKGNIRQGRPTPVLQKMGSTLQVNDFYDKYSHEETIKNSQGENETIIVIDFDPDQMLVLGNDAEMKYAAPAPFTTDTLNLLQILFYLFVQHTGLPEFLLGGAIGSSKASAESQLEPFLKFIEMKRGEAMAWINPLVELYLAWVGTYNRRARNLTAVPLWRPMAAGDGRLTLDTVIWAWSKGFMDDEMALWLLPLNITDASMFLDRVKRLGLSPQQQAAQDVATAAADAAQMAGTSVPASGGGTQGTFKKQEQPEQPTERQMTMDDLDRLAMEVVERVKDAEVSESAETAA